MPTIRATAVAILLPAVLAACSGAAEPDTAAFTDAIASQLDVQAPEGAPWDVECDEVTEVPAPGDVLGCTAVDGDAGDTWTIDATVTDEEGNVELDVVRQ